MDSSSSISTEHLRSSKEFDNPVTPDQQSRLPDYKSFSSPVVTISFLSHIFFLISVVRHPYFSFAPSYEETDLYLLAFPEYSSPLMFPL